MKLNTALAAILAGTLVTASSSAAQAVTIEVGYPYSALFDVTFERIYPLFRKAHPRDEYDPARGRCG
jgi:multiple sugar transport system substrate-binding protein